MTAHETVAILNCINATNKWYQEIAKYVAMYPDNKYFQAIASGFHGETESATAYYDLAWELIHREGFKACYEFDKEHNTDGAARTAGEEIIKTFRGKYAK